MQEKFKWIYKNILVTIWMQFHTGEWVTGLAEWIFMYVSRSVSFLMTFSVGFTIYYTLDMNRDTNILATLTHPDLWDGIAKFSDGVLNVGPELVFPGTILLAVLAALKPGRSFNKWFPAISYAASGLIFFILTCIVLSHKGSDENFRHTMFLWRTVASLGYTVVVEINSHLQKTAAKSRHDKIEELEKLLQEYEEKQKAVAEIEPAPEPAIDMKTVLQQIADQHQKNLLDMQNFVSSKIATVQQSNEQTIATVQRMNEETLQAVQQTQISIQEITSFYVGAYTALPDQEQAQIPEKSSAPKQTRQRNNNTNEDEDLNRKILEVLREHPEYKSRDIAELVGVSHTTVTRRLKKLTITQTVTEQDVTETVTVQQNEPKHDTDKLLEMTVTEEELPSATEHHTDKLPVVVTELQTEELEPVTI